jgi:hypothetical protein
MSGLTYSTYVTQIATMAVVPTTDPNYQTIIPSMIDYAELRMQRDLDFLNTVATNSYTPSTVQPTLSLSTGTTNYPYVTVQNIAVNDPTSGFSKQLTPVSKEWIYNVYPIGSTGGLPVYYAPFDDNVYLLGPQPDQTYTYSVVGTQRFPSLSPTNSTTFISIYLPDVFIMASMIYISAYQRNFTSMASNDPQMAVTYESQYQALLKGAMVEEARKKFEASGWSSMSPPLAATPAR